MAMDAIATSLLKDVVAELQQISKRLEETNKKLDSLRLAVEQQRNRPARAP
jgi:tetrahydromethanopterin S-methyltransferase subunit G